MSYNPFNPTSVVVPNLFAGRKEQILEVFKKLALIKHKMAASFFVFGERGIGKTSLVRLVKYVAESESDELCDIKMLTSYYLVEKGQDLGSVLEESLNNLTNQMSQSVLKTIGNELGNLFSNGKFSIGAFGVQVGAEVEDPNKKSITIKDQSVSIISNIIQALDEEKKRGLLSEDDKKIQPAEGVLIIIDEIHNLKDIHLAASVLRNIITTLDVGGVGAVSFVLVGYKVDKEAFFSGDPSAHRTFDPLPLEIMPDNEASEVLEKGFKEAGLDYDKDALSENITVAGGYPHSLQILGHQLVDVDTDKRISEDDWDEAVFRTSIRLRDKEFSGMYSFGKKKKVTDKILDYIASQDKPVSKKQLSNEFKENNIYQSVKQLKQSGAVKENEEGNVELQSNLFKTAILIERFISKHKKRRLESKK